MLTTQIEFGLQVHTSPKSYRDRELYSALGEFGTKNICRTGMAQKYPSSFECKRGDSHSVWFMLCFSLEYHQYGFIGFQKDICSTAYKTCKMRNIFAVGEFLNIARKSGNFLTEKKVRPRIYFSIYLFDITVFGGGWGV